MNWKLTSSTCTVPPCVDDPSLLALGCVLSAVSDESGTSVVAEEEALGPAAALFPLSDSALSVELGTSGELPVATFCEPDVGDAWLTSCASPSISLTMSLNAVGLIP